MNRDAFIYRLYFAAKDLGAAGLLRRIPHVDHKLKQFLRFALPHKPVWVRVKSGLSQGLWMRVSLPDEVRLWRGEHEITLQHAIRAVVRPGSIVYDIGAHTGSIALGVARLVGPLGSVVAFEADHENVEALKENSSRNLLTASLQVVESAVWSHVASQIPFRRSGIRRSHGGVEADGEHPVLASGELVNVPATTLDDFIAGGPPVPQLVKIDVEGGEYEVLRGGESLFTKHRPLIIAEVHHAVAAGQIRAWLPEHRYCYRWIIPLEDFPRALFAWPEGYEGTVWIWSS
jgi:FkbM family methyltransferase